MLSPDGKSWILNGEKMWLTNAGFADVYITFAKVDGEHFTAFIIDKGSPGVSLGAEEKKTGIKGSLDAAAHPAGRDDPAREPAGRDRQGPQDRLQHPQHRPLQAGRGRHRRRQAGDRAGGRVREVAHGLRPARSPTSAWCSEKLGEMAIRAYVAESMVYRTAGMIDRNLEGVDLSRSAESR